MPTEFLLDENNGRKSAGFKRPVRVQVPPPAPHLSLRQANRDRLVLRA
jgi:hypothetical protein